MEVENRFAKIVFIFLLLVFFALLGVLWPSGEFSQGRAYAQGEGKYIIFGPYVPLNPGKYEIAFTLKIADNKTSQSIATIDVVAKKAQKLFASRTLKGTDFKSPNIYQDFNLRFDTTLGARDFEFRIKYLGGSRLWTKKIGVTRLESYSHEESVGADLIKGATKSSGSVVTEAESFLKRSRHRVIGIKDLMLSRRYLVSDSEASDDPALVVEPAAVEVFARGPWKISKSWLLLIYGFIAGYLFILTSISIYQRIDVINRLRRLKKISFDVLGKIKTFISKYASSEYPLLIALATGIILSVFSENVVLFGFAIKGEYLFILFIILSLIWGTDSRMSIAVALLFLVSCSFVLIYQQEQSAERIAIYIYYFLVVGVVFQLKEYIVEAKLAREKAGLVKIQEVVPDEVLPVEKIRAPEELAILPISDAEHRVEQRRKRRQKIRRLQLVAIIVSLVVGLFAVSVFLWAKPLDKPATKVRRDLYGSKSRDRPEGLSLPSSREKEKTSIDKGNIKLQVQNGNGIQGEAANIGNLLKNDGFNVIGTENADNFDYLETIIRYKSGLDDLAGLVKQQIGGSYFAILQDNLPSDYGVDIEVILGRKGAR